MPQLDAIRPDDGLADGDARGRAPASAPEVGFGVPASRVLDSTGAAGGPEELWAQYVATRDEAVRGRLAVRYAPLVKYVVSRLAISLPAVLDSDDVLGYGLIGLLDAIDRFDPARGVKFESYAVPRVRGAIIDALRSLDPLSRSARDRVREIERALTGLEGELGRPPADEEVAAHLGITVDRYHQQCSQGTVTVLSLDNLLEFDDSLAQPDHREFLEDRASPAPPDVVERQELLRDLARAILRLPERERLVLALYYNEELTMKEISRAMDVSESRVCQLHSQAIARLKVYLGHHVDEAVS